MSIKQIGPNLWFLNVRVWKDGKEYRTRKEFQGGKKAAEAQYWELKQELQQRANAKIRSLTVEDFTTFNEALDFYCNNVDLSKSRADCYFAKLREIGDTPIESLSKVFKEFIRIERKVCAKKSGNVLSNGAINKLKVYALASLNYAVREERIKENPLRNIRKDTEEPRRVILSPSDEKNLLKAITEVSPEIYYFIRYCLSVPCRKGELIWAPKTYYNPFRNTITIPAGNTKNGRQCIKAVPPDMVEYFKNGIPEDCPWLFYIYKEDSKQYKPIGWYLQKAWERAVKKAKLDGLRIHDLRHHSVTKLIDAGNPRQWVMSVAGWSTDMLSIYYNQHGDSVADKIRFFPIPDTQPDTTGLKTG
jgi:integrase